MRTIKFRAWKKSENRMLGWNELCNTGKLDDALWGTYLESVMQFTGLTDKNGVEIYEDDICDYDYEDDPSRPFVVIYDNAAFRKKYEEWDDTLPMPCLGSEEIELLNIKVIGNIWENPELLETSEKSEN